MQIRSVGIDLGKTTFHLVALGDNGKVLLKKKFTQRQLITFTANLQTTLIGLEAWAGTTAWVRGLVICLDQVSGPTGNVRDRRVQVRLKLDPRLMQMRQEFEAFNALLPR